MEVHLTPDLQAQLDKLAADTGRSREDLVQDATAAYLAELAQVRQTLDSRYDDLKSGRVKPLNGEAFFEDLRKREEELLKRHHHDDD